MKITLNWLRELIDVGLSASEIADTLTMAGIEVESVEERSPPWTGVEVAEVLDVAPHPNADRLRLCRVRRAGSEALVGCGASNMRVGDKVALALPGTVLPGDRHIERTTIRGQVSEGMLCSASELALSGDETGILILPDDAPVGGRLVDYLGAEDTILDLAVTPNRGDCLSVLGIARELVALTGAVLRAQRVTLAEDEAAASQLARIEIEAPELCPRYCARVVRGVGIGPSPPWLRTRLEMVGLRPISNVVDATNYVMLERGQPLHAFDFARLAGGQVTARRAGRAQRYATLDGAARELVPDDLVIADARGPVALAGVMGGAESEIHAATTDVLLESAFFIPETVRRTARRLGIVTESSYRFERGVDPEGTVLALDRVTELIVRMAGGSVARGVLEKRAGDRLGERAIRLRPQRVNFLLGTELGAAEIGRHLSALGAGVAAPTEGSLRVVPPSHRFDLQSEIDLVEEVARLAGYQSIPATLPAVRVGGPGPGPQRRAEQRIREALRAAGLSEMVTLGLIAAEENRTFPGLGDTTSGPVALANPLSADAAELRLSLLPGLLRALDENLRQGEPLVAAFSLGRVYRRQADGYQEGPSLALLLAGRWPRPEIGEADRACGFGDLKGTVDLVFARLHAESPRWERLAAGAPYLHPARSARVTVGGTLCGLAGVLHPDLVASRRLDVEPWLAELDLRRVLQYVPARFAVRPLPRFPAVTRDLAVVADRGFEAQQVLDAIREAAQPLVEEVRVFDHYTGSPIPEGRKSVAYSISYRAADRTLTDEEVNELHEELLGRVLRRLPVEVRR